MSYLLRIDSSASSAESTSRRVADTFVDAWTGTSSAETLP